MQAARDQQGSSFMIRELPLTAGVLCPGQEISREKEEEIREQFEIEKKDVDFSYRSCSFFQNNIAIEAVLFGQPASHETIAEKMASYSQKRWKAQPKARSAGCIFKNPDSISAGQLIDELGFKGTTEGGAMVSEEHGNFIVNKGGATPGDFLKLIERIRQRAYEKRGVDLKTEVQIIGRVENNE